MEISRETFLAISSIAEEAAGLHLPLSKQAMVAARLSKRLARLGLKSFEEYLSVISGEQALERSRMVAALTTNVSTFFREPHHFETLRQSVLPTLLKRARQGERVRIWSAGCANGQEAYSIALTILEADPDAFSYDIRILGTDLDPSVVKFAHLGAYHASMMDRVPPQIAARHFSNDASTDTWIASQNLQKLTLFRELNLHGSWPMPGRFDIIFCRNVVIYFNSNARKTLWSRLERKLAKGGWLFVGHSERVCDEAAPKLRLEEHTVYRHA